jgi:Tfp pilus assembly pilus retraction ATPase PilT
VPLNPTSLAPASESPKANLDHSASTLSDRRKGVGAAFRRIPEHIQTIEELGLSEHIRGGG